MLNEVEVNFGPYEPPEGCRACGEVHWWESPPSWVTEMGHWLRAVHEVTGWLGEKARCPNAEPVRVVFHKRGPMVVGLRRRRGHPEDGWRCWGPSKSPSLPRPRGTP